MAGDASRGATPAHRTVEEEVRFLRSILSTVPAFVARVDSELKIRYMNRYQPGITEADTIGKPITDFVDPAYHDVNIEAIERALATRKPVRFMVEGKGAHGAPAYYESTAVPVEEADGSVEVALVAVDVTEHVARAEALKDSEETLRVMVEATGVGLWRYQVASSEVEWNEAMRRIMGRDEPTAPDRYLVDLVHPDDRHLIEKEITRLAAGSDLNWPPHRIVRPDGTVRHVIVRGVVHTDSEGKPLRVIGGHLDITDIKRMEDHLSRAQKLDAVGSLTMGIAHNFNNMLMVILPTIDLVRGDVSAQQEELLDSALAAAQQAAELVRGLMTFAGQNRGQARRLCNLSELVQRATSLCASTFDRHIKVSCDAPRRLDVPCDPTGLEQVIINLLVNARDALRDAHVERPSIHVTVEKATQVIHRDIPDAPEPPFARIRVTDNGVGIPEELRGRVFEPFFTTKEVGQGTGLGLATSYATVRAHGGVIRCDSSLGQGTTFEICLPLAAPDQARVHEAPVRHQILIVDDEPAVLQVVARALSAVEDYSVRTATSAEQGLQALATQRADLILLDCSMPERPGPEAMADFREHCPGAKVVLFTGQEVPLSVRETADGVIEKPVELKPLLRTVASFLSDSN